MKKLTFQQPTGFHQDFIKTYHGIVGKCGAADGNETWLAGKPFHLLVGGLDGLFVGKS